MLNVPNLDKLIATEITPPALPESLRRLVESVEA